MRELEGRLCALHGIGEVLAGGEEVEISVKRKKSEVGVTEGEKNVLIKE